MLCHYASGHFLFVEYMCFQSALAEASRAKADGIDLHVIGIGSSVRRSELSTMASTESIHLNDYADLGGDEALDKLYSFMNGWYCRHLCILPE